MERAFTIAAKQVQSSEGGRGRVKIEGRLDYESFLLGPREAVVELANKAVSSAGRQPQIAISNGGLDANWLNAHGIPTVTLGCGQMNVHMTSEMLDLAAYRDACRIALLLATGM
jgi:tripeptide aminopeptidase